EQYSHVCLDYLEGMFAFALWDQKNRKLFIARDRLGKKPLVYWHDDCFAFSSELNSLLQAPFIKREVDYEALNLYLTFLYVPAPWTMFKNVRKLPPAHYLVIDKNKVEIKRYWRLVHRICPRRSFNEYKEGLMANLEDAVRKRMVSDVPLGAFLSGGIDSSAIVALMAKNSTESLNTFSVGFANQLYNELNFAGSVAGKFKTKHNELIVSPNVLEVLPKITKHYGEPFADYSSIPTYYLAEFAARSVKVVLTGDGGDESFAGYYRYTAAQMAEIFSLLPGFLIRSINVFMQNLYASDDIRKINWQIKRFFKSLRYEPRERYLRWISAFNHEEKALLYNHDFLQQLNLRQDQSVFNGYYEHKSGRDFSDLTRQAEIESYLPFDLLVKTDIATMAHSLEARSPFLDHKFMEFAATIPYDLKLHNFSNKYILKQAFKNNLPRQIIRRKKQGFGLPIGQWYRGKLKEYVLDVLFDPRTLNRGYFRKESVQEIVDEHMRHNVDNGYKIGALLMLELWHREFMDTNR
ncbi:MAG: asparagine synthase (glutamine-hydrolyzing), partial [Candidatus Omnitrophica bacterium]|nr:asparagine synthase (glutamine-hydrolyzing) [Candidatus Omnitrophota bacterium]